MLSWKSCQQTPLTQSTVKLNKEHRKIIIDEEKKVGEKKEASNKLKLLLIDHWLPSKIKVLSTARDIATPINSQTGLF